MNLARMRPVERLRLLSRYVIAYCGGGTLIASALAWSLFYLTETTRSAQNPGEIIAALAAAPLAGFFMFTEALATFGTSMLAAALLIFAVTSARGRASPRAAALLSGASASVSWVLVQSVGLSDHGFPFPPWMQLLATMVAGAICALIVAKFDVRSGGFN